MLPNRCTNYAKVILIALVLFTRSLALPPSLQSSLDHQYRVSEELPLGTRLGNLRVDLKGKFAELGLADDGADVKFKIVNFADPGVGTFEMRYDGWLVVIRRLDREQLCPVSSTSPSNLFTSHVDPSSLLPTNSFDGYDDPICLLHLRISLQSTDNSGEAWSSNQKSSSSSPTIVNIGVLIDDVNDNAPQWPSRIQRFKVVFRDGDPVGERRTLPPASDPDLGSNAKLTYELITASMSDSRENVGDIRTLSSYETPFSLIDNPVDGLSLYATKQLDREERDRYQLILRAVDQPVDSVQQQTSTLLLDIEIEDVNDNAPTFSQPLFSTPQPIGETTPVGSTVLFLNASDADSGVNGAFHFGFSRQHAWLDSERLARSYFDVRPNGQITVRRKLDVDKLTSSSTSHDRSGSRQRQLAEFRFRVLVEDEAVRPYSKSSEASVLIQVEDENDESPVVYVTGLSSSGDATPRQSSQSFSGGGGGFQGESFIHLTLGEHRPSQTPVALIQVYDPDFNSNDNVECSVGNANFTLLAQPASIGHRQLSPPITSRRVATTNLHLVTTVDLDREQSPNQLVPLTCFDSARHQTIRNLTIHLTDRNDNPPQFKRPLFEMSVEENRPVGSRLQLIDSKAGATHPSPQPLLAFDRDIGLNARITYHLTDARGSNISLFNIDPLMGVVSTGREFDYEEQSSYDLIVYAVDAGQPPLTGTASIKVSILNLNDNPPSFDSDEYVFHIDENSPRNTELGQVKASDADSPNSPGLIYFLDPIDREAKPFRVDSRSGRIHSLLSLDREAKQQYSFHLLARDSSQLPGRSSGADDTLHTASTLVTVIVDDVNDNAPQFVSPNSTANMLAVSSTQAPPADNRQQLAYIQAKDRDEGPNAVISYRIRSDNSHGLFDLDSQSGLLCLDWSKQQQQQQEQTRRHGLHLLNLEACDQPLIEAERKCTLFTGLKVLIKDKSDSNGQSPVDLEAMTRSLSGHEQEQSYSTAMEHAVAHQRRQRAYRTSASSTGYTPNEIMIMCLSLVFGIVLLAIVVLLIVLRRRSKLLTSSSRDQSKPRLNDKPPGTPSSQPTSGQLLLQSPLGFDPQHESKSPIYHGDQHPPTMPQSVYSIDSMMIDSPHYQDHYGGFAITKGSVLTVGIDEGKSRNRIIDFLVSSMFEGKNINAYHRPAPTAINNRTVLVASALGKSCTSQAQDEYQTLDHLGQARTSPSTGWPLSSYSRSNLTNQPTPAAVYSQKQPCIDANPQPLPDFLLNHNPHLMTKSPPPPQLIDVTNPHAVRHAYSRSQPQPMSPDDFSCSRRPSFRLAKPKPLVSSSTAANSDDLPSPLTTYAKTTPGLPSQSRTYYELRDVGNSGSDSTNDQHPLPSSKSHRELAIVANQSTDLQPTSDFPLLTDDDANKQYKAPVYQSEASFV